MKENIAIPKSEPDTSGQVSDERSPTRSFVAVTDKAGWVYPLMCAFVIPLVLGLFQSSLLRSFRGLLFWFFILLPFIILLRILYDWLHDEETLLRSLFKYLRPVPPGLVIGTDLKRYQFPCVTLALVISNAFCFFLISPIVDLDRWVFFPVEDHSIYQILLTTVTSAFLHGGIDHIFSNMVFLWVFGSALESRIGAGRFAVIYMVSLAFSKVLICVLLVLQSIQGGSFENFFEFHSLGASGAISGVMGVFVVRCYFARVSLAVPLPLMSFLSMSIKVQALLLIGLFFALDVSGSVRQFAENAGRINYWSHVGGYIGGFLMGYLMRLHVAASREAVNVKAERLSKDFFSEKDARRIYRDILAENPEDETALEFMFKFHRMNPEKAGSYYTRLIPVLISSDFNRALEVFTEHYPQYINNLPGGALFRFGIHFYRNADLDKARNCLRVAADKQGPWQPKAMMVLAEIFIALDNRDRAAITLKDLCRHFPESPFHGEAQKVLAQIS